MIESLFDHKATVRRATESEDELAEALSSYADAGEIDLALVPPKTRPREFAGAEVPAGEVEGYAAADANVQTGDVLNVTSGPEAPSSWRVLGVAHPRGRFAAMTLERTRAV